VLSDREKRTLHEVEAHLATQDPGFARSLRQRQRRMSHTRSGKHTDRIVFAIATVLALGGLWSGSPTSALAFVVAVVLAWTMWHSTSIPHDDRRPRKRVE